MGRSRKMSQWFKLHQAWCMPRVDLVMHQEHTVGDRFFVDCTGFQRILREPRTAAITPVELFVAAPGASSCMCAEAAPRPCAADLRGSLRHAFALSGSHHRRRYPECCGDPQKPGRCVAAHQVVPELDEPLPGRFPTSAPVLRAGSRLMNYARNLRTPEFQPSAVSTTAPAPRNWPLELIRPGTGKPILTTA